MRSEIEIYNNVKSQIALNELISSGYYKGIVDSTRIELSRKMIFPSGTKYMINGTILENNKIKLKAELKQGMKISIGIFFLLAAFALIYSLIIKNWILSGILAVIIIPNIINISFGLKKELEIFIDQYHEFYST